MICEIFWVCIICSNHHKKLPVRLWWIGSFYIYVEDSVSTLLQPQEIFLPLIRLLDATKRYSPQSHWHCQRMWPLFLCSEGAKAVSMPKRVPDKSLYRVQPQERTVPPVRLLVVTIVVLPHWQIHFHTTKPLLRISVFSITVSFPNCFPVRSFSRPHPQDLVRPLVRFGVGTPFIFPQSHWQFHTIKPLAR